MRSERKNQYDSFYNRDGRRLGGQKTVGKTLPPKTGPKTPFTADAAASQIARQRLGSLAADHEGESITAMKMMSLFDGSGGFPLAAAICGIEPVYASEVEPYPIAVTRSRFPKMIHLGDVSKVHGWDLEPVDVITFGSPCQDMSIAGKRAGIKNTAAGDEETTRSGLFLEAVRIIREMREATNGRYPAFAVWENVPGAFSSNKGEDFRIVLQELVGIVEPEAVVPEVPKGGWNYFDLWMGDKWSLAYRTVDAQHWGVPQRRRRIYLVLDLRGGRAGKVLFEPEGLRGYPAPRREARKATSTNAERCADVHDSNCLTPWDVQPRHIFPEGGVWGTLYAGQGGGHGYVFMKQRPQNCLTPWENQARRIYSADGIFPTLSSREKAGQNGQAVLAPCECWPKVANTLIARQDGSPQPDKGSGGNIIALHLLQDPISLKNVSPCISQGSKSGACCIGIAAGFKSGQGAQARSIGWEENRTPTLASEAGGNSVPAICVKRFDARGNGNTVSTLTGDHQNRVTDYTTVVCIQGNCIDRSDTAGCNGAGWKKDCCYTLNTIDRPAVAYCMAHGQSNAEIAENKSPCLNCNHEQPILFTEESNLRYIVRRLTPTECARLQGFPDWWGHPDQKEDFTEDEYRFWLNVRNTHAVINGRTEKQYTKEQMLSWYNKLHTDSSEYKMWGNGIALPNALYVMIGIRKELVLEKKGEK